VAQQFVGGVATDLVRTPSSLPSTSATQVGVWVENTTARIFIDGAETASFSDPALASTGLVGMATARDFQSSCVFDDLLVFE
jgi:hypothetical protein